MHGGGSSSSSQAQSDMSALLFVVIVSFPFIFVYTCSYQFIVMFYLACLLFLLAGHSGLSAAIGAASWGAAG
jgi:nitrate reductase NapE component